MTTEKMTYKQLEEKVMTNRARLRETTSPAEKRALIEENHSLMVEMDRCWKGERK